MKHPGKSQRTKGHNWERAVASDLKSIYGGSVRRGLQSRGGGGEQADVICPDWHVECKVGRLPNPRAALKQAVDDSVKSCLQKIPVAVVKDDRQEPFVVLQYRDWLKHVRHVRSLQWLLFNVEKGEAFDLKTLQGEQE